MSEKELNSYRFLSGEEPSDEMLSCIMREVAEEAVSRQRATQERIHAELQIQREALQKEWANRINAATHE